MSKNGRVKIDGVIFNENIFFLKPKFHYEIEELEKESENSQIVLPYRRKYYGSLD